MNEPNPGGGNDYVTKYTYDIYNHLTDVNMWLDQSSSQQSRHFVYDANQRLQSATNPENGTVTYTYNQDGTVATKTDAKNQGEKGTAFSAPFSALTWSATLDVTVSDGSETVDCPTVNWSATLTATMANGRPQVSGQLTVDQP